MKDWEDILKERLAGRKADLPESDWNDFLSRRAAHERAARKRRRILAASISIPAAAAVLLLLFLLPVRKNPADQTDPKQLTAEMIEKIKKYDKPSDPSARTGIDNGEEEMVSMGDVGLSGVVAKVQTVKVNDSVSFNTATYAAPEGSSSLEDLVRQLPGAQIDSNGNITVNGKTIQRILINGKQFFPANREYVDLGLSVKWAKCNVGANRPEETGGLYAWGETEPKTDYSFSTYKFCVDGNRYKFSKYNDTDGKTVLDPEDDVAHVKWGGNWRMPTWDEMQELLNRCTWTYTTQNDVEGYRVTSKVPGFEGRSIFMPFNVFLDKSTLREGEYPAWGQYWSSTLISGDEWPVVNQSEHVWGISLCCDATMGNGTYRNEGRSIRPVCP